MRRYYLKKGDKSSAGGVVLEGEETCTHYGTAMTYHGAKVWCPACKTTGVICNVPPYRPDTIMGKQTALDNDLCICKCSPPPRLIASQNTDSVSFGTDELAAMRGGADGRPTSRQPISDLNVFDERFTLTDKSGTPLPDMYYTVKLPSGELKHGTTDSQGRTARYRTSNANRLSVYLGHRTGA